MNHFKIYFFCVVCYISPFLSNSQDIIPSYNAPSTVCLDENVDVHNMSTNASGYVWDFCTGDYLATPNAINITTVGPVVNALTGASYISDGDKWYGFFLNRASPSKIFRSESPSLVNMTGSSVTELSTVTSSLVQSEAMDFVEGNDGIWYAYVGHLGVSTGIVRLKFGNGLNNEPTIIENIGDPENTRIRGLKLFESNNLFYLITTNYNTNKISVFSLGSSPFGAIASSNIKTSGVIAQLSLPTGVEIIESEGDIIAYVVSQSNGNLVRLNFGSSLENTPVFEKSYSLELSQPRKLRIVKDGAEYFLTVGSEGESISIVALGDLNVNFAVNKITHENLPKSFGYAIADSASTKYIITASTDKVSYFVFNKDCNASQNYSEKFEPLISYSAPGTYPITLTAYDEDGNSSSITKEITVTDNTAPTIDFTNASQCMTDPITFTGLSDQTLTSQTWDFGDETTATGSEVSHQYTTPGTYKVRLTVASENGCGNFIEKEVNIYDAPAPDFSFPATSICTNGEISFTNTTPGEYKEGDITWSWDFGDGEGSNEKSPMHTYTTGGTKTVKLTASIPGCSATKTYDITVIEGPSVDFIAENLCFDEEVQFTNLSTGDGITGYEWDFGNGETSTAQHPKMVYDATGVYEVSLTVKNAVGCSNTLTKSVTIRALPAVDFGYLAACSGDPTQFMNNSIVADGGIGSWKWIFGDGNGSTEENPAHTFEEPGEYDVKLIVTSSAGCVDSVQQTITIDEAPIADFDVALGCPGALTYLTNASLDPANSGIEVSYWVINGIYHYTENPAVLFTKAGTYTVTLAITSGSSCKSTITKNIVIDPLPTANFTFDNACIGQSVQFTDQSTTVGDDEIVSWSWEFGEFTTSDQKSPTVEFPEAGAYPVTLTVTSERGCSIVVNKTVNINSLPVAAFAPQSNFGAPPLSVDFSNNSTGASSYQWWFGDDENTMSQEAEPTFVYNEVGDYEVKMVATNSGGCTDTAYATISVLVSVFDVAIDDISVFVNTGNMQMVLKLTNKGTVPVSDMNISLNLGGILSLNERFSETIDPGETLNYPVGFDILEKDLPHVPYICATLSFDEKNLEEEDLTDNSLCHDIKGVFLLEDLYPNPVNQYINIDFFMPEESQVDLMIMDMLGNAVIDQALPDIKVGLNSYRYDLSNLTAGIYIIKISHKNDILLRKVMVQ